MIAVFFILNSLLFLVDAGKNRGIFDSDDWGLGQYFDSILREVTKPIATYICSSENSTELYDVMQESIECFGTTHGLHNLCVIENKSECLVKVEEYIKKCDNPLLLGLPKYIFKMLFSLVNFFCKSHLRDLIELLNPCLNINPMNLGICIFNVINPFKTDTRSLADHVCSNISEGTDCIMVEVKKNCKNDDNTIKNFNDLLNAALVKPCEA